MNLPKRDRRFLSERGFAWQLVGDGAGGACLVVDDFDTSGGGFVPPSTTLMIRVPPQYPMAPLDMWYCDPPLRIAATGQLPQAAEVIEAHAGRSWQRFSRHLNGSWQPGVDGLRSFLALIQRELQGLGSPR